METNPRLWTFSSSNSPQLLPSQSMLFTQRRLYALDCPNSSSSDTISSHDELISFANGYTHQSISLGDMLEKENTENIDQRYPILLNGECANPYRLQDINIGPLPLLVVRLEDVCRTWADSLDAREVRPGVHHVTIASSKGWWEPSILGLATKPQMKKLLGWLNEGNRDSWKPLKLAEGVVRFEQSPLPSSPSDSMIEWDGQTERLSHTMPEPSGPSISTELIFVPIHVRLGTYNNRGRIVRCVHKNQREFHEKLFRRGSSFKWNEVLKTR